MGIELELIVLIILQTLGSALFARFESETPALRKILKWGTLYGVTTGLYFLVQHWALLFPITILITGAIFHFIWCKKNGIHPIKATPRRKYYELRKWKWEE